MMTGMELLEPSRIGRRSRSRPVMDRALAGGTVRTTAGAVRQPGALSKTSRLIRGMHEVLLAVRKLPFLPCQSGAPP